jgi:hypothetical protein
MSSKFYPLKEYSLSFTVLSKRFRSLYLHRLQQYSLNFVLYILFSIFFYQINRNFRKRIFWQNILDVRILQTTIWRGEIWFFRAFLDATTTNLSSLVPPHPRSSLRGFFWNGSSTPQHPRSSVPPPPSSSTLVLLLPCRGPPRHHIEACLCRHSRGLQRLCSSSTELLRPTVSDDLHAGGLPFDRGPPRI